MKLLLTFFAAAFLISSPQWRTDFEQAKKEAAQSHKAVLLNFSGSDWCGPCIRLKKEIFESDTFNHFAADNLILVNADFPRLKKNSLPKPLVKQNETLADQYNHEGKFPYTLLMDTSGKVLKSWDGYPDESPEKFIAEINTIVHASH